jgi:hypothetical protein
MAHNLLQLTPDWVKEIQLNGGRSSQFVGKDVDQYNTNKNEGIVILCWLKRQKDQSISALEAQIVPR